MFGHSVSSSAGQVTAADRLHVAAFSMYPDLTVAENLDFFATIRGVRKADRRSGRRACSTGMGLAEFTTRQAQHLSGGMKQKLMLATTLMHEPDLLLLDEPTTGVDPVSRREFWRILADLHRAGKTVLVATPYMDEAERCTHVAFLDSGRISSHGTPDEIKAQVPGHAWWRCAARGPAGRAGRRPGTCPGWRPPTCSATSFACCGRGPRSPSRCSAPRSPRRGAPAPPPVRSPPDMESVFAFLADAAARPTEEAS